MPRAFIVSTGRPMWIRREHTPSATEALRLVLGHMQRRRPGVKIEDETGNSVTFFQLKALAEAEGRERDRRR
jgi:hypothetical protein